MMYECMMFTQAAPGVNNDLYSNDVLTAYINIMQCLFLFLEFLDSEFLFYMNREIVI